MKKLFPIHLSICTALLAASSLALNAQVTLVDSVGFGNTTGSGDDTDGNPATRTVDSSEYGSFDANGVDKLVVVIGGEGDSNGSSNNHVTGVTYGGVPMSMVMEGYSGNRGSSMWYLDNVAVSGDFVITFTESQSGLGFAAYALNGTAAGNATSTVSTAKTAGTTGYNDDMSLTTSVNGEFVIAALARNNFDDGGGQGIQPPLTPLYYASNTDGSSAAGAYQSVEYASTIIPTIYQITNNAGTVIAASFPPADPPGVNTVDSTTFISYTDTGTSLTITPTDIPGFTVSGDKLVVTITGEGSGNAADDNTVTGVTYGGIPMTQAVVAAVGNRRASVWYLDLAGISPVGSDFIIGFATSQEGVGFGALSLIGTKPGHANQNSVQGSSELSFTTAVPGEFIVAAAVRNNWDPTADVGSRVQAPLNTLFFNHITTGTPLTDDGTLSAGPDGGAMVASAYAAYGTPGVQTLTIYDLDNNTGAFGAASFQPATSDAQITSITSVGVDLWELTLTGEASTDYMFYSAPDLDFGSGTLIENLQPGAVPAGTIGGTNDSVITTDTNGDAVVRLVLTGTRNFVRAETP